MRSVDKFPDMKLHYPAKKPAMQGSDLHNHSDNRKKSENHICVAKELVTKFFFTQTNHSRGRRLNMLSSGLVRKCQPKGTDFCKVSDEGVSNIQDRPNVCPGKALGFRTPAEAMFGRK